MAAQTITIALDLRRLHMLNVQLEGRAEGVLTKIATNIEQGWKDNIETLHVIDTGAYLDSVHVEEPHPRLQRTIADGVEYGIFQEFGTRYMSARPCLIPAIEKQRHSIASAWGELFS